MLRKTKDLRGYKLAARDGEIGRVKDFYFDDQTWTVRYLVADTGDWLPHRKVLVSPLSVTGLHAAPHTAVEVNLTRKQIEESPSIESHKPVSRQFEAKYFEHFGWPYYWPGPLLWGPVDLPGPFIPATLPDAPPSRAPIAEEDLHLRSVGEITAFPGYHIQALDQAFGHVEQFVVDDQSWAILYLVAETRNWWPGKHVLISPQWVSWVSWAEARVYVDLDRETIRRAPEYDPRAELTREYEEQLFAHYSRPAYWEPQPVLGGGTAQ